MKIGIAQISPKRGDIEKNIALHKEMIHLAKEKEVNAIFFSELSITGYEPELASVLKVHPSDKRFEIFQKISNEEGITIGIGVPTESEEGANISMLLFEPQNSLQIYSKQILHEDEKPYFKEGNAQVILNLKRYKIAPAICYESLQMEHLENAIHKGAEIYVASVAKSQKGIDKANDYFPKVAKEKSIPILMANCVGFCDNFQSIGQSSIWNRQGILMEQLNESEEGILIYDTETETTLKIEKENSH